MTLLHRCPRVCAFVIIICVKNHHNAININYSINIHTHTHIYIYIYITPIMFVKSMLRHILNVTINLLSVKYQLAQNRFGAIWSKTLFSLLVYSSRSTSIKYDFWFDIQCKLLNIFVLNFKRKNGFKDSKLNKRCMQPRDLLVMTPLKSFLWYDS